MAFINKYFDFTLNEDALGRAKQYAQKLANANGCVYHVLRVGVTGFYVVSEYERYSQHPALKSIAEFRPDRVYLELTDDEAEIVKSCLDKVREDTAPPAAKSLWQKLREGLSRSDSKRQDAI